METNNCTFIGNLTRDVQMRQTKNGTAVGQFSIACNRVSVSPDGTKKEFTDFINVQTWGALAEACGEQLRKGSRVIVQGRYSTRSYEQEGQKRYVTEIVAGMVAVPVEAKKQERGDFSQFGQVRNNFNQEEIPF